MYIVQASLTAQLESGSLEKKNHDLAPEFMAYASMEFQPYEPHLGARSWFVFSSRHFQAVQLAKLVQVTHQLA